MHNYRFDISWHYITANGELKKYIHERKVECFLNTSTYVKTLINSLI